MSASRDRVRDILAEAEATILTDPQPTAHSREVCPMHPEMERQILKLTGEVAGDRAETRALVASVDRLERAISDAFGLIRETDDTNGQQNTELAVIRNTLSTELRRKAVVYGLACSVLTGLIVVIADHALK